MNFSAYEDFNQHSAHFYKIHFNIILFTLRSPKRSLPVCFQRSILQSPLNATCHIHLFFPDFITSVSLGINYAPHHHPICFTILLLCLTIMLHSNIVNFMFFYSNETQVVCSHKTRRDLFVSSRWRYSQNWAAVSIPVNLYLFFWIIFWFVPSFLNRLHFHWINFFLNFFWFVTVIHEYTTFSKN
jgi:hypothetical protein